MRNGFLIILIQLSLAACGRGTIDQTSIDPAFNSIVAEFNAEAAAHGNSARAESLTIQFGDLSGVQNSAGAEEGRCESSNGRTITIDRTAWGQLTPSEQEELVFHELGHCVLNRKHDPEMVLDLTAGFIPASIMHASLVGLSTYTSRRAEYVDELFSK